MAGQLFRVWPMAGLFCSCHRRPPLCFVVLGLFSTMSLTPGSSDVFLREMYIGKRLITLFARKIPSPSTLRDLEPGEPLRGPTVYVFLLTALCLTVLDRLQTLVASTVSFGSSAEAVHKAQAKSEHKKKRQQKGAASVPSRPMPSQASSGSRFLPSPWALLRWLAEKALRVCSS